MENLKISILAGLGVFLTLILGMENLFVTCIEEYGIAILIIIILVVALLSFIVGLLICLIVNILIRNDHK